jgi:hypothetical protein
MVRDKVITVMCAARLPEMLVKRVDAAAASAGVSRAQFIAEACRMRLDGPIVGKVVSVGTIQPPDNLPPLPYYQVESTDYPGLERRKTDTQRLRDICAGKIDIMIPSDGAPEPVLCTHKEWAEDGEQYRCRLQAGHKGKCAPGERVS